MQMTLQKLSCWIFCVVILQGICWLWDYAVFPKFPFQYFWFDVVLLLYRLSRCTFITTGEDGPIPRCKPFKYTYEKEIVIYPFNEIYHIFICYLFALFKYILNPWLNDTYAYFKKLDYFSTECNTWFFYCAILFFTLKNNSSSNIWRCYDGTSIKK